MSLLLLYKPHEGAGPPPASTPPLRTLLGVGMVFVILVGWVFA